MDSLIYTRQSQDRDGNELGVTRQAEDCQRLAELRGWNVVGRESDNDLSASGKVKRPGFEAVLDAITSGRVKVVIAWDLTRLSRNRRDQLRLVEACQAAGAVIALVRGSDLDMSTPAGRMVADILGATARHEIEQKSDRQRRAQEQAAAAGRRVGGRRPFGYDSTGMQIIEDEAKAIRDGYADLLAGVPLGSIARTWNERDLLTGQGSRWRHNNVRDVLNNPRNAGLRRYKGEIVGTAQWPEIVPEATYRAAAALLQDPSRRTAPRGAMALLTGIARCGVCDATVHAGGAATKYRNYRCSGSQGHVSRRGDVVDDYVRDLIIERLSRPDAAELLVDQDAPDLEQVQADILAATSRLESLAVEFADGDLTAAQVRVATDRLRRRIAELESVIADAGRVDVLGPLIEAEDVTAAWEEMSTERQRAVIHTLVTVRILPPGRGTRTFREESVEVKLKGRRLSLA